MKNITSRMRTGIITLAASPPMYVVSALIWTTLCGIGPLPECKTYASAFYGLITSLVVSAIIAVSGTVIIIQEIINPTMED